MQSRGQITLASSATGQPGQGLSSAWVRLLFGSASKTSWQYIGAQISWLCNCLHICLLSKQIWSIQNPLVCMVQGPSPYNNYCKKGSLFCTFLRAVVPSPSRLTPAENPSLLPEWLELFEKPPGPPGPSPCPGEGSRSLQLTCSAEELTNDQGDLNWTVPASL